MWPTRSSIYRLMAFMAIASILTGCGKDSPTSPSSVSQQDADDSAQQVGFFMGQGNGGSPFAVYETGQNSVVASLGHRSNPYGMTPRGGEPDGGTLTPMVIVPSDTTFAVGNVTWTLSRSWFDAADNLQANYDPITTVRVSATARGTGMIETPTDTASFGSSGNLDITGISVLQTSLTTNGARHDTLQCSAR